MKRNSLLEILFSIISLILFFIIILFLKTSYTNKLVNDDLLKIHFINVGQGDSTLITFNNNSLLIDAGPGLVSHKTLKYIKNQGITKLNHVIATHPHEDHIGGMEKIINYFTIDNFYAPKVSTNTKEFKRMIRALKRKNIKITKAFINKNVNFAPNIKCDFIAPCSNKYDNLNNYSAGIKLKYKKCAFIFTGDAEKASENEIVKNNSDLKCDVLKIGHHGSSTSTNENFLNKTSPSVAIISCGYKNSYGHPSKSTLKKLLNKQVKVFRTDIHGDVILKCNGYSIKRILPKN